MTTTQQLFKDTQEFVRSVQPTYDERGHITIADTGVIVYVDSDSFSYLVVKIAGDADIEYTIGNSASNWKPESIALAYAILAVAKARTADYSPAPIEPVEVTLEYIAALKGVDVKRIKVVEG